MQGDVSLQVFDRADLAQSFFALVRLRWQGLAEHQPVHGLHLPGQHSLPQFFAAQGSPKAKRAKQALAE